MFMCSVVFGTNLQLASRIQRFRRKWIGNCRVTLKSASQELPWSIYPLINFKKKRKKLILKKGLRLKERTIWMAAIG